MWETQGQISSHLHPHSQFLPTPHIALLSLEPEALTQEEANLTDPQTGLAT